ncbi:MAG: AAA family ATPase [Enterovibrio sp.]
MNIKEFHLTRFGCFEQLDIKLAPTKTHNSNITVFIGSNGTGKTLLLKALMTNLSWFVAHLRGKSWDGKPIFEGDILNDKPSAQIDITIFDKLNDPDNSEASEDNLYHWSLVKTQIGNKAKLNSDLTGAARLADAYKAAIEHKKSASLPLVAFYPVNRVLIDVPSKIKDRHNFLQMDGYDNALEQGVDFRRFFEWFREREDLDNELALPYDMIAPLQQPNGAVCDDAWHGVPLAAAACQKQLSIVRSAVSSFMPGFNNLRVHRKPRLHMSIDKNGQTLNVLQLSQGEKTLLALAGDIARRLVMMNPELANPLHGRGVILIDEIDMHLHCAWQSTIIERLASTFPNCQFVLTTHSPLVISEQCNVLVYSLDDGEIREVTSQHNESKKVRC